MYHLRWYNPNISDPFPVQRPGNIRVPDGSRSFGDGERRKLRWWIQDEFICPVEGRSIKKAGFITNLGRTTQKNNQKFTRKFRRKTMCCQEWFQGLFWWWILEMLAETGLYVEPEETNQLFFVFMAQSPQPGDSCSSNPEDMQFPASRGRWFTELAARNGWNVKMWSWWQQHSFLPPEMLVKHWSMKPVFALKCSKTWRVSMGGFHFLAPVLWPTEPEASSPGKWDIPFAASSNHYHGARFEGKPTKKYAEQSSRCQKSVQFGDRNSWDKKGMEFPVVFNTKLYSNQNETKKILP